MFSTAVAGSEISGQVVETLRQAADLLPEVRAERLRALRERIKSLERRGFVNRQQYSAPTTGDFERRLAWTLKK